MTTFASIRRRVSVVLAVALLVSVAANVAAAEPTVIGRAVAAWPPLALLATVEVVSRSPKPDGWLGVVSGLATLAVAGVAAVASFTHMRAVALVAGESSLVAVLFPLTVDGLAVVCSASLVEISRRMSGVGRGQGEEVVSLAVDESPGESVVGLVSSDASLPVGGGVSVGRQPVVLLARNGSSPYANEGSS